MTTLLLHSTAGDPHAAGVRGERCGFRSDLAGLTLGGQVCTRMPRTPVRALLRSGCKLTRHPQRGAAEELQSSFGTR